MKKYILSFVILLSLTSIVACNQSEPTQNSEQHTSTQTEQSNSEENTIQSTVSGSFTVSVRSVIPDYCYDDKTPTVAVVTEFQSYPFTMYVGEEIAEQLEPDNTYVFTIKPMVVDYSKEYLEQLNLSSFVWEFPDFEITDFRLANEEELGMSSLSLTIE